jgi:hypothetical protein
MAVYKRTYRRYDGQLTAQWSRFLVLTRYSLSTLFDSRPFTAFVVLSAIPLLLSGVVIYLDHSPMARTLLQIAGPFLQIDPRFFRQILQNQGMLAFLITAWAGPGLVAPDLANQACRVRAGEDGCALSPALSHYVVAGAAAFRFAIWSGRSRLVQGKLLGDGSDFTRRHPMDHRNFSSVAGYLRLGALAHGGQRLSVWGLLRLLSFC